MNLGCPNRLKILLTIVVAVAVAATAPLASAASKRIVALTPFTANTLAGIGVKPVGVGQTLGGQKRLSRKLAGVRELPLSHPNGPNMEQLARLDPGLVLSSLTWRKGKRTIESLDIRVVESDPERVADVAPEIRRIGKVVGRRKQARKLAASVAAGIAKARKGIKSRPKVLVLLGVGRTPFAFLANSWGGDLVSKAGGSLLTAGLDEPGGFARISDEQVLAENPDVILAVPHANEEDIPGIVDYMRDNPVWKSTKAGQNDRIYISNDNSLLQAGTDTGRVIRTIRSRYLKN
jgi:iron complex transport system substrate-binding protein